MLNPSIIRKFIEVISIKNWQVLSENNTWNDIVSINKTIPYHEWCIEFSDDSILKCADDHILITSTGEEVYARNAKDKVFVNRNNELMLVKYVYPTFRLKHMYDLSLAENTNHLYYTNNVLSHNSTTYCIFLLWYLIFNPEKKVLIAANKKATSLDILSKISLAFEMLPNWIKPGLLEYNKGKMKFGNLSEIVAEATSSDAARGTSCNILVLDEFAFAEQAEKFWASVYPIISSDINGKVLIVSTPNGVGNLFHKIWEKANTNGPDNDEGWKPMRVDWWEVPGRDEKWRKQQTASLGSSDLFEQEFGNCVSGDTVINLYDEQNDIKYDVTFDQLFSNYRRKLKVLTPNGYKSFSHVKMSCAKCIKFITESNITIKATEEHRFIINGNEIFAKDLAIGDFLETKNGLDKIVNIIKSDKLIQVYDLVNVEDGSIYYTNNILSHNCFLSSTWKKLISDDIIMKFRQTMANDNIKGEILSVNEEDPDCKFTYTCYHKFDPRRTYLAAADSAEGTQGDASVLYIFDITNFSNIKMCAKFSQNNVSTTEFAYIMFNILKKYYNPYLAIERNTIGAAVLDALCETVYNYENVVVLNKHNKPGIMSHMQIKQKACLWIRELFAINEFNIHLYDSTVIDEMDTFIKKDTAQHVVYGAMVKKHDDHIMCLIWSMYILSQELLQQYYNVIEWDTTDIGKTIPKVIMPLIPYEISQKEYDKFIENAKDNKDLYIPNKIEEVNTIKKKDRFFGHLDEDDEMTIDMLEDVAFYHNMIG